MFLLGKAKSYSIMNIDEEPHRRDIEPQSRPDSLQASLRDGLSQNEVETWWESQALCTPITSSGGG